MGNKNRTHIQRLKDSIVYQHLASLFHRLVVAIDPQIEMKRIYKKVYHKSPNLKEPKNLVEKTYWLQLHSDTSMWTRCADKYGLRSFVEELGLEEYLPSLYGKWDKAEDIDLTGNDKPCILKTNNGCAQCVIVLDPRTVDICEIRNRFKRWLKIPYGYAGGQLHYTRIKPCIIAEELLVQSEEDKKVSPDSLIDYKVWCFNGSPECVWVAYNRHDGAFVDMALYDLRWNSLAKYLRNTSTDIYRPDIEIPKPKCLNEMLEIASKLTKPFPEVRADFYIINDRPIIGELTFTAGYGFYTDEYYEYLGSKVDLTKVLRIK